MGSGSQSETETVDNRVQVLKSVPVNLSLNPEHLDSKRDQCGPEGAEAAAVAVVKAEVYAPVFMGAGAVHYRPEGEEQHTRVVYEQSHTYDAVTLSHSAYGKDEQRSSPDSTYEEDNNGVSRAAGSEEEQEKNHDHKNNCQPPYLEYTVLVETLMHNCHQH